ncbi:MULTISPECIES: HNH endonuclease [unclassified Exiguobacterium]|uniref:HNH endonuclease n=1 Tax=unclassified Exiguobacterium TaxID=2644629 RepID=UPI001BE78271|nr:MULTISPECIES: HNH endonuclease [unclassified Exiguobacterium]
MHIIDSEKRYFTKKLLIETNNAAIREKRNRQLVEHYLEDLDENKVYPIILSLDEHNRGEIRVLIVFDEQGTKAFLDMSKKRYNLLPKAIENEDGTIELESEESINSRRLYPEGREYVETVGRKLIRDSSFRKNVLTAYNNQCAMCEISKSSLLVAAHIYPAYMCGDDSINNGICLCKIHDKLYEDGDIFIKPTGEITSSNKKVVLKQSHIRMPLNEDDMPSTIRLNQKLKDSILKKS